MGNGGVGGAGGYGASGDGGNAGNGGLGGVFGDGGPVVPAVWVTLTAGLPVLAVTPGSSATAEPAAMASSAAAQSPRRVGWAATGAWCSATAAPAV